MKIPGLVDLQVNGYRGVDFSGPELSGGDFGRACRGLLEAGASAFLPTVITSTADTYRRNLSLIAEAIDTSEFQGRLPGIHLEGPFISAEPGARGAHNPAWICECDCEYLGRLIEWSHGKIKLLTVAADVAGSAELTQYAVGRGISVSLGHHLSGSDDLARLVRAGARALTHLGNGVPAVLRRHDNPIWAGLAEDDLFALIITDGHHLPAELIKTIIRTKSVSRCIITSDASPLAGMPPGRYKAWQSEVVLEKTGKLYNPRTGYLAGSSATILQCMNYLAGLNLLSLEELIAVGFYNPLRLIGVDPASIPSGPEIFFDEEKHLFLIK